MVLRFADLRPFHHVVLLLIIFSGPEESGLVLGDLLVERLMKAVEAHEEPQEAGQRGVDQNHAGRFRKLAPFPGLNAMLHTGHRGAEVRHGEA